MIRKAFSLHRFCAGMLQIALASGCGFAQQTASWTLEPLLPRPEDPDSTHIVDQNDFMSCASPDGQTVVFTSGRSGVLRQYLMGVDGSDQRPITRGPGNQKQGSWSPDGKHIVYVQQDDDRQYLVVMDSDGSNARTLVDPVGSWPIASWSPDGTRILYNAPGPFGLDDVMSIDPNGEHAEVVLGSPATERHAWWSPDGNRIVFSSNKDGDYEIYTAEVFGGKWTRLTDNQVNDYTPMWSPAGDKIVFQSYRGGKWTIVSINADGSDQEALTRYPDQWDPAWSHDGTKIFFNSDRDGRRGIYVMNADGSLQRKLTNTDESSFLTVVREAGVADAVKLYWTTRAANPKGVYFYEEEVAYLVQNFLAIDHTRKAVLLSEVNVDSYPESKAAHINLATARYAAGDVRGAVESYEAAQALDPDDEQIPRLIEQLQAESSTGE